MLSFEISLPKVTEAEVVEWFEFMNRQCILSKEIIKLVSQHIASQSSALETASDKPLQDTAIDEPMANLFNWKDSGSTLFIEDKKTKKKMLIV